MLPGLRQRLHEKMSPDFLEDLAKQVLPSPRSSGPRVRMVGTQPDPPYFVQRAGLRQYLLGTWMKHGEPG